MPLFFPLFGVFWLASLIFWIWALVDCIRVADDSMYKSGNKVIWVIIIVLTYTLGAIIYLIVGRPAGGPTSVSPPGLPPPGQPPPVPPPPV